MAALKLTGSGPGCFSDKKIYSMAAKVKFELKYVKYCMSSDSEGFPRKMEIGLPVYIFGQKFMCICSFECFSIVDMNFTRKVSPSLET